MATADHHGMFDGLDGDIVRTLRAGDGERAAAALVAHLGASRDKAADRLRRFHEGHAVAPVPYITD